MLKIVYWLDKSVRRAPGRRTGRWELGTSGGPRGTPGGPACRSVSW
ncbi:MAG: hypothetical protein LBT40_08040 [Deltaproteobacteria bacterium]|nr:hypothetical protein [Deltaproteobacteria bacterium]